MTQTINWVTGERAVVGNAKRTTATIELRPFNKGWHVKRLKPDGTVRSWAECDTIRRAEYYALTGDFPA